MANLELTQYRDYWDVVIVDECHRVASSASTFTRYEKVLNHLSARHKYGLTATPERSDGLIRATFALLGQVVWEVPDSAVADRTMQVKVHPEDTETDITEDCLNTDGTINYVKLIEHLTTDPDRNKQIARAIMANKGHSCLILSDRLEQLETIRALLPYEMQEKSAYINGKMQSKKAKAEREQAIEDMRTGEKLYLFASYSLAKEGLDVPCLDRLFLASPAKFSAVVTQAVGRIQRTAEGKDTPVVIDFVDTEIGFCERAYRERCRSYRKIGAIIEKGFLRNG
jgi:superfamily II DNA or RNA helicase